MSENRRLVACFKCSEGCVHLEYDNLMFTFSQDQFLAFSEIITEARRRLLIERDAEPTPHLAEEFSLSAESFVM